MKPADLSDVELLYLEGIEAAEAGDQERSRELLSLALSLDESQAPGGPPSSPEVAGAGDPVPGPEGQPDAADAPGEPPTAGQLIRDGIEAAEAGDHERALDLLSLGLSLDQGHSRGWLWLSGEVRSAADRAFCLRQVLALDPGNRFALQGLALLREQARRTDGALSPAQDLPHEPGPLDNLRQALAAGAILDEDPAGEGPVEVSLDRFAAGPAAEPVRRARPASPGIARFFLLNEFALIAALGLGLLLLIALGVQGLPAPLPLLRLLLGLAFVLFVPGYALQAALFPRSGAPSPGSGQGLDGPERLALSFGLSVALVPILALILDRLPWGLRLWPIVIAEGLVIAVLSVVALVRRWRLPVQDRPVLVARVDLKGWWGEQDRTGRVLYGLLAFALLLALGSAAAIILLPKPGELFTEFYILGPEGLAESYPREAAPGESLSVTAGIANREGQAAEYRIEVQVDGELIGAAGPVALGDGEIWEAPLAYALPRAGDDQQVEFLLYRDGGAEPYRQLRLWINIVEAPGGRDE